MAHWKKKKAIKTWEKGIAHLRDNTQDTYRLARLLLEEASYLLKDNPNDEKAHKYLIEAKDLFAQLGAKLDIQRVDELLGTGNAVTKTMESCQELTLTLQLNSLLNVTRAIGSVSVLGELLDKIIDQAMKVTGAERGFLFLYDEDKSLKVNVLRGVEDELHNRAFSYETHKVSPEMIQRVEGGSEALIAGQDSSALPEIASKLKKYEVKEAICVPLEAKDKAHKMASLGTLVSGIAHEINNPISYVMLNAPVFEKIWGGVKLILDEYCQKNGDFRISNMSYNELSEVIPLLLSDIIDGAKRVKNIVTDLKEFARQSPPELTDMVDMNKLVERAMGLVSNLINKSTNRFSATYEKDLPLVKGNLQRIEQVFINLLVNACQALSNKRQAIIVSTRYDCESDYVVVEIQDQGAPRQEIPIDRKYHNIHR